MKDDPVIQATAAKQGPPRSPESPPAGVPHVPVDHGPLATRRRGRILRRVLATFDALSLLVAAGLAYWLGDTFDIGLAYWTLVFLPVWILILKLSGLYDLDHRRIRHSTVDEIPRLVSAITIGGAALGGFLALTPATPLQSRQVAIVCVAALGATFLARASIRGLWRRVTGREVAILLGCGPLAATVARRLKIHPESTIDLVGYIADLEHGRDAPALYDRTLRLGAAEDLVRLVPKHGIERVVVADEQLTEDRLRGLIDDCKAQGLSLTVVPQHSGLLGPGVELNRIGEFPLLDFGFGDAPRSTLMLKRAMDLTISFVALIALSPLLLLLAALIKVDSRGPVLFRQVRVGQGERRFSMLKFRTMVADACEQVPELVDLLALPEPAFKLRNDPRRTRIGATLRRYSLDELPQLLNVLKGEMSLVGPRPEEEAVVNLYTDAQRIRLTVKPGMTGPMQVYGRAELSFEERLALERDYIDSISIAGDLAILFRTPAAIMRGDGAY